MLITTNKENWTGEEVTVKVNKAKRTFKLFDEEFKIKKETKGLYCITGKSWEYPLGRVYEHTHSYKPEEQSFTAWNESIERNGKDIFEASIRFLCNII